MIDTAREGIIGLKLTKLTPGPPDTGLSLCPLALGIPAEVPWGFFFGLGLVSFCFFLAGIVNVESLQQKENKL